MQREEKETKCGSREKQKKIKENKNIKSPNHPARQAAEINPEKTESNRDGDGGRRGEREGNKPRRRRYKYDY